MIDSSVLHTEINAVKEGQIECSSDRELLVLGENDMTTVVALLDGFQDVCRVIFTIAESLDAAGLGSCRRSWAGLLRVIRIRRMVWSLGSSNAHASLIDRCRQYC